MDPILECQHRQHCRLFQLPWRPCCSTNPCLSGTEDPGIWANGAAAQGMAQDGVQHADARVASQGNFTGVAGHGVGRESRDFLRWARHARDPAVAGPLFRNVTKRARDDDVGGDDQSNSVCNRGKIACRYLRCSGRGVASPWRSDLRLGIMTS